MAAISLCLCALPPAAKLPLAALSAWHGWRLARAHWRSPACQLRFDPGQPPVMHSRGETTVLADAQLSLRGALAALSWRDSGGRQRTMLWCADTLSPTARRELRLRLGGAASDTP